LNGSKSFISNGGIADYYAVFAMTERLGEGARRHPHAAAADGARSRSSVARPIL